MKKIVVGALTVIGAATVISVVTPMMIMFAYAFGYALFG